MSDQTREVINYCNSNKDRIKCSRIFFIKMESVIKFHSILNHNKSYVSVGWTMLTDMHDEGIEYSKMEHKIM